MDFSLNEEQRAIAEMAGSLFADHCSDEHMTASLRSGAAFDRELWRKVVDTGLNKLLLTESVGGSGLGFIEMSLVLQAQGRALANVPLWQSQLATATMLRFRGSFAPALMAKLIRGEAIAALSLGGLFRAHGLSLRAKKSRESWTLNGMVAAVPLGAQADLALLVVEVEGGPRLAAVELRGSQIVVSEGTGTNGERVADLRFSDTPIAGECLLPEDALSWLEPRAIASVASLQLGVSERQVERTVEYIGERVQFGRTIAAFQAVQMKMADCFIRREVLRTSLWQLCYRLDAGVGVEAQALATLFHCCETGQWVGHAAQHVHGGVGVDRSYPMHRYLLWSRELGMTLGGPNATLARLGQWLADNDKLGWKYDLKEHQKI